MRIIQIEAEQQFLKEEAKMTRIQFNCGCGFHSTNQTEAEVHAKTKNHKITVSGSVTPDSN